MVSIIDYALAILRENNFIFISLRDAIVMTGAKIFLVINY